MARHTFGGGIADWTFIEVDGVDGVDDLAQLDGGVVVTFWNAASGGTQYTDLLDVGQSPVTSVMSDAGGQIPEFYGPDGVAQMWAEAGGGQRALMVATDAAAIADSALAAANAAAANLSAHLSPSDSNPHNTLYGSLDDVNMTGLVNGQVPVWDVATQRWRPGTPSSAPGSTAAAAVLVASSDAPQTVKDAADFVCDGTGDQTEVNAAIAAAVPAAGGRGKVQLTGGRFNLSGSVIMRTGVWLQGAGPFTELKAINLTALSGAGDQVALVKLFDINTHLTHLSDMWISGNFSAGGSVAHGICYESASSGDSHAGYPATSPDPSHQVRNLYVQGFSNGTARHGIYLRNDLRNCSVRNVLVREVGGNGVFLESAPDNHLTDITVGSVTGTGFRIATGNAKLTSCKAFYCDAWGFDFSSGRGSMAACESQDNANGIRFAGSSMNCAGMTVDTSLTNSVEIATNSLSLVGMVVLNRGNGRYPTTANGFVFTGSPSNLNVVGVVTASGVTNKVVGTFTAGTNFIRISDGSTLVTQGA